MILADSNIWIDHIRSVDPALADLVASNRVLIHPFVIGEIALGGVKNRACLMIRLGRLSSVILARDEDVLRLIESAHLHGTGLGYVDAHLLASAKLTPTTRLWTRDKRLHAQAERLGIAFASPS